MKCLTDPRGGYSDLKEGTEVLILDIEGSSIAKGRLGDGKTSDENMRVCVFPFEVSGVKLDGDLFSVQVSHRDGPTYSKDEIQEPLTLSLL